MVKLLVINFLIFFVFNLGHPVTPQMLIEKGSPDYINGFLSGSFSLSMFIFSPLVVNLYSKIKLKNIIAIGVIGYGLTQIGFVLSDSSIAMIFFRFVSGIVISGVSVTLLVYASEYNKKYSSINVFSYVFATTAIGGVCGILFSGNISYIGVNNVFYLQTLLCIILGIIVTFGLEKLNLNKNNTKATFISNIKLMISSKSVIVNCMFLFLSTLTYIIFSSNIGYYVSTVFKFESQEVSYVTAAMSFMIFLGNMFIVNILKKYFVDKLSLNIISIFCIILMILSFITKNNILVLFLLLCVVMLMNIVKPIITEILVNKSNENDSSNILAMINSLMSLSAIISGFSAGILYSISPNMMFYVMFVIILFLQAIILTYKNEF